ncbi:MAG: tyrosine-protein phosphatase [Kiritimatiellae bacterium]|nr:tyrosine-protein phosphatase [Kiritimatiellia bacterium]
MTNRNHFCCVHRLVEVASAFLFVFVFSASAEKMPPLPDGAFTYAVIPDTQGYDGVGRHTKRGRAPGVGPTNNEKFTAIVNWIVANVTNENIRFVTHTGDITDMNNDYQWTFASNLMAKLDGVVPYAIVPGNHDMKSSGDTTFFRKYFPAARYSGNAWYAGTFPGFQSTEGFWSSGDNANSCCLFENGDEKFVVLHLECNAPDPVLEWGNEMLAKYADRHAIIATHQDLGAKEAKDGRKFYNESTALKEAGKDPWDYKPDLSILGRIKWLKCHGKNRGNSGKAIWEKLSSRHANVFLVVSGDQGMISITQVDEKGKNGNMVHSLMYDCGSAHLRLFRFIPAERAVKCYTIDCGQNGEIVHSLRYWKEDKLFNFTLPYPEEPKTVENEGKGTPADDPRIAARVVSWEGVPNARDLGGLPGLGGKTVRRGLVFRSSGLNNNAHYREKGTKKKLPKEQWIGPGKTRLSEKAIAHLINDLGIKTDLDLRSDPEVFGMTGSPLGDKVRWVRISSSDYGGMDSSTGREAFTKDFQVFLDKANYPIVFHCIAGADRTGSLACILNGLLGVDEELLYRDWVYTWKALGSSPSEKHWPALMKVFAKYKGATLNERIEAYVLSCGFSKDDIETFRSIMLE